MLPKKKIKTGLFFTVFIILITFTIPMALFAEPPVKCPCFTSQAIKRDIAKAMTNGVMCFHDSATFMADINIISVNNAEVARYTVGGPPVNNNPYKCAMVLDNGANLICGRTSSTYEADLCDTSVQQACYNEILEAWPECSGS
jgi:hypothetical protein